MESPSLPPFTPDPVVLRRARRVFRPLQRYHRHRVVGLHHFTTPGPLLMVAHHSLATYDAFLLGLAIVEATGRTVRGLGDDLIFRTPGLRDMARAVGLLPASPEAGHALLAQGEILGVAPGGMWESLRPSSERYRIRWETRAGFARLALRAGAPVVPVACPRADELYTVYPSRLTNLAYKALKVPLPVARGLGPTAVPRPVQLTHYVAPPIVPPPYDPAREADQLLWLRDQVEEAMEALLKRREPGLPVWNGAEGLLERYPR
jgi:1-acyl-sn-glycerol-3-phosphate acyltransferase